MSYLFIAKNENGEKALRSIIFDKDKGGKLELINQTPYTLRFTYSGLVNKLLGKIMTKQQQELTLPSLKDWLFKKHLKKFDLKIDDIKVKVED